MPRKRDIKIVSFSGIDGAGKSTQISALESLLHDAGVRTTLLTFWDDVVVGSGLREFMSHKAFKGERGIGTPERPVNRRDKNVSSWLVTGLRLILYLADSINLRLVVGRMEMTESEVLIFDRYIYDELANLPLTHWLLRGLVRVLLRLIPKPDVAFLIDADPVAARARKPEYPLVFLHHNRQCYLALSEISGNMTIIEPLSIEATETKMREVLLQKLSPAQSRLCAAPALR